MNESLDREFEAQLDALSQFENLRKERDDILQLIKSNTGPLLAESRTNHEKNKSSLKSDLKKATAFVKKLRTVNLEGLQQCIRDTETLNLNLHISEIVTAISETNYKATDIPSMVKLCVSLHRRYEEFTKGLINSIKTVLTTPNTEDEKEYSKKRRIIIRFSIELYQVGVWTDADFFLDLLYTILGKSKTKSGKQSIDLAGLSTFIKYGCEILIGMIPRKYYIIATSAGKKQEDIPNKLIASPNISNQMKNILTETYTQLSDDLLKTYKELKIKEKKNEKDKLLHGSLTEQKQTEYDNCKKLYEKLYNAVITFAECSEFEIPNLEVYKDEDDSLHGSSSSSSQLDASSTGGIGLLSINPFTSITSDYGPYGDSETKAFYEELPDLLTLVPLSTLGFTLEQANTLRETWKLSKDQPSSLPDDSLFDADLDINTTTPTINTIATTSGSGSGSGSGSSNNMLKESLSSNSMTEDTMGDLMSTLIEEEGTSTTMTAGNEDTPHMKLNQLLQDKLPECITKSKADEFCVSFCYLQMKGSRKRLMSILLKIPRGRNELIPIYARIIASLQRIYPEFPKTIINTLIKEFYGQLKYNNKTSNYSTDARIRNIRYLGELIKFHICPPIIAFRIFKALFNDFISFNIDLLAIFLETCGRYLYLLPYTHDKINDVLETLLRLRRVKHMDLRQQTALEMAYFAVKPPERVQREKKEYTTIQKYARYLIMERLSNKLIPVDVIITSLRRLPWNDDNNENLEEIVCEAILYMARNKYICIPELADCLSGLIRYVPNLCIRVIDNIWEEVQLGLDAPHKREPQNLLGLIRLYGELYNYSLLTSQNIFDLLYYCINYSHRIASYPPLYPSSSNTTTTITTATTTNDQTTSTTTTTTTTLNNNPISINTNSSNSTNTATLSTSILKLPSPSTYTSTLYYDPRIPSEFDASTDLFRAQIICELLNTCGSYYVRGTTRDKLIKFLLYFQRYLMTKSTLPLHIEFSILDTFDYLEQLARNLDLEKKKKEALKSLKSQDKHQKGAPKIEEIDIYIEEPIFKRYETIEEVQQAITVYEALTINTMEIEVDEECGEDDEDRDEIGDDDQETTSAATEITTKDQNENDDGDSSEDDEEHAEQAEGREVDVDVEEDHELSNENAAKLLHQLRIQEEEDDEFEKAFKLLLQQSVESVKTAASSQKATMDVNRMAIPAVLPQPKNIMTRTVITKKSQSHRNKYHHHDSDDDEDHSHHSDHSEEDEEHEEEEEEHEEYEERPKGIPFKLLGRDTKGRIETRALYVPEEAPMVVKIMKNEELRRLEKQRLKEKVLQMESLAAAAAEQEAYLDEPVSRNTGRPIITTTHSSNSSSSRMKYTHSSMYHSKYSYDSSTRRGANDENTLNLDQFLAETDAAELRKLTDKLHQNK